MKRQPLQDTTFFRLTPSVRDRLLEINLTAAEWRIWCYLVSLDPFGDRGAKFSPAELMLKCKIKKTTYFSAKAKFQKLGLFDFRDGVTKVVNLQTSLISEASGYSQQAVTIDSEISESKFGNSESHSEISESKFGNSESQSLKPLPRKASKSPQTLQTYLDFKDSLSESERENFFNFVKEKTNNLERPINDLEAWLASKNAAGSNRWEIYYKNYQEEKIGESARTNKQNPGSENYSPSKLQDVILRFQNRRRINEPEPDREPKEVDREEIKRQQAEINRLMDNPPEYEVRKSADQQQQEAMAEIRRQQEANRKAAEKRARQEQEFNLEERQAEIQRQIEAFNRIQNIGKIDGEIDEIDEEVKDDE